jgi:predicted enzyme related to lactoylglutathione lyase
MATSTRAHGKICYLEIPATDIAVSADFYRGVFGWQTRTRGDGALAFDDGLGEVSGTWVTGRAPSEQPGLLLYVMVDSVAEASRQCSHMAARSYNRSAWTHPRSPRASATLVATSSPFTRSPTPSDAADAACRLLDRPDEGWHCRGAIRAGCGDCGKGDD